jgi:argininosuccinate synthase
MSTPVVVAVLGDSSARLSQLVQSSRAAVVAVALDLGEGPSLAELKAAALAAGAVRCHALDVRDEFVRAVLFPAAQRRTVAERRDALESLGAAFVAQTVHDIAAIEKGRVESMPTSIAGTRVAKPALPGPATLALTVEGGEPVALNDITMTPRELVDSLETIAGTPAIEIVHQVLRELDGAEAGHVILKVHAGVCTIHSAATV